jgi:hypothetical protein
MRISRSWLAAPVLLSAGFLPWNLLPAKARHEPAMLERESPRPPRPSTGDSVPSGLVVVRHVNDSPQQDRQLYDKAIKNPFISGVAFQIHWREIEPVEGRPDWSKLDQLFAAAESSKKWVQLCVYAGFFSPAWALEGARTDQFPAQWELAATAARMSCLKVASLIFSLNCRRRVSTTEVSWTDGTDTGRVALEVRGNVRQSESGSGSACVSCRRLGVVERAGTPCRRG